jgi:hypothetical protein
MHTPKGLQFIRIPELPSAKHFDEWFGNVDVSKSRVFKLKAQVLSDLLGVDSVRLAQQFECTSGDLDNSNPLSTTTLKVPILNDLFGGVSTIHETPRNGGGLWHFDEGRPLLHAQGKVNEPNGIRPVFFTLVSGTFPEEGSHRFPQREYLVDGVVYHGYTSLGEGLCFANEVYVTDESEAATPLAHSFFGSGTWAMLDSGLT